MATALDQIMKLQGELSKNVSDLSGLLVQSEAQRNETLQLLQKLNQERLEFEKDKLLQEASQGNNELYYKLAQLTGVIDREEYKESRMLPGDKFDMAGTHDDKKKKLLAKDIQLLHLVLIYYKKIKRNVKDWDFDNKVRDALRNLFDKILLDPKTLRMFHKYRCSDIANFSSIFGVKERLGMFERMKYRYMKIRKRAKLEPLLRALSSYFVDVYNSKERTPLYTVTNPKIRLGSEGDNYE